LTRWEHHRHKPYPTASGDTHNSPAITLSNDPGRLRGYAVLSLATKRSRKGTERRYESRTHWHRPVAWNQPTESRPPSRKALNSWAAPNQLDPVACAYCAHRDPLCKQGGRNVSFPACCNLEFVSRMPWRYLSAHDSYLSLPAGCAEPSRPDPSATFGPSGCLRIKSTAEPIPQAVAIPVLSLT
jgi:hypothetical protein